MRRLVIALLTLLALSSLLAVASTAMARDDDRRGREGRTILEFDTMVGVSGPFKGVASKPFTRDIPGGGVAWTLRSGRGELDTNGHLEIRVEGLVFAEPSATGVPAGTNPVNAFRAIVSCLTINAAGAAAIVNLVTDPFPAVAGPPGTPNVGNARIETTVPLPHPCIAPIVFVANGVTQLTQDNPFPAWFASTGAP